MLEVIAMLKQGGWVMFPIGFCSLVALTIIIERGIALRRGTVIDPRVLRLLEDYAGESSADAALHACRRMRGPLARIIEEIIKTRDLDHDQSMEKMNVAGRTHVNALERGLTLLEVVGNISPLLGLLGTVLGMITVFDAITARGIGNPQVLSDGIAKALITTVAGLCVAIPAVAFHSWFGRRVDDIAAEIQDRASGFIFKIHAGRKNDSKK